MAGVIVSDSIEAGIEIDCLIIGGGAAGLMCAAIAGARGRRVRVLEKTRRCGKKILMSGGGRCNFTNLYCSPDNFLSANPHYCKSALSRYTPADFIALVEAHHIAYHEKERGQLFCDHSAKAIVAMLLQECAAVGATIDNEIAIERVARDPEHGFVVYTAQGEYRAASVVVATGGLPIPKMGASDFGLSVARAFDLPIRDTRAALVPFTLGGAFGSDDCAFTWLISQSSSFVWSRMSKHRVCSVAPKMAQIDTFYDRVLFNFRLGILNRIKCPDCPDNVP